MAAQSGCNIAALPKPCGPGRPGSGQPSSHALPHARQRYGQPWEKKTRPPDDRPITGRAGISRGGPPPCCWLARLPGGAAQRLQRRLVWRPADRRTQSLADNGLDQAARPAAWVWPPNAAMQATRKQAAWHNSSASEARRLRSVSASTMSYAELAVRRNDPAEGPAEQLERALALAPLGGGTPPPSSPAVPLPVPPCALTASTSLGPCL